MNIALQFSDIMKRKKKGLQLLRNWTLIQLRIDQGVQ